MAFDGEAAADDGDARRRCRLAGNCEVGIADNHFVIAHVDDTANLEDNNAGTVSLKRGAQGTRTVARQSCDADDFPASAAFRARGPAKRAHPGRFRRGRLSCDCGQIRARIGRSAHSRAAAEHDGHASDEGRQCVA